MPLDTTGMASWHEVVTHLANASKSVRLLAPLRQEWQLPFDQEFLTYASPPASDRRYLLTSPRRPDDREASFLLGLQRLRWQVMWVNSPPSLLGVIIDDGVVYVSANATRASAYLRTSIGSGKQARRTPALRLSTMMCLRPWGQRRFRRSRSQRKPNGITSFIPWHGEPTMSTGWSPDSSRNSLLSYFRGTTPAARSN